MSSTTDPTWGQRVPGRKAGKRGKLPSYIPRGVGSLRHYLTSPLPTPPSSFDYGPRVTGGFPMALNDELGDCTIAGVVHVLQLAYAVVGKTFEYPGDDAVRETYFGLTGGGDTGLVETDVLHAWMTSGLFGTKILGWAPVDVADRNLLTTACYAFGHLYLGGDIPQDAETQFEDGAWWSLEPGANPPVGGHCFVGSGANERGTDDVTWGAEDGFTWNWWHYYGTNAYVVFPEVFADAGHGPLDSIDANKLRADLKAV